MGWSNIQHGGGNLLQDLGGWDGGGGVCNIKDTAIWRISPLIEDWRMYAGKLDVLLWLVLGRIIRCKCQR